MTVSMLAHAPRYTKRSHCKFNLSNDKAELSVVSVKLLVIVLIVIKCYIVHVVKCKVVVSFVATLKKMKFAKI